MKYQLLALLAMLTTTTTAPAWEYDSYNEPNQGFYIGALGGPSLLYVHDREFNINYDPGFAIGVNFGYQFCEGLRLETELGYRRYEFDRIKLEEIPIPGTGHSESTTLMFNAYYHYELPCYVTPYFGFGIGYAHLHETVSDFGLVTSYRDDRFAWQAIVGIDTEIDCDLNLGVEYRYLSAHENADDQTVNIILRRFF